MTRYREPGVITGLVYIYHLAVICVALGTWLEDIPYPGDSMMELWVWVVMFGVAGALGMGARIAQSVITCRWRARILEAWILTAGSAVWLLWALDVTISAHPGERPWRAIAALIAAAVAAAIMGITEASYNLQRLRIARQRDTLLAETAREMRLGHGGDGA